MLSIGRLLALGLVAAIALLALTAPAGRAQEPGPNPGVNPGATRPAADSLAGTTLKLDLLKNWGQRSYRYTAPSPGAPGPAAQDLGEVKLATALENGRVVLKDSISLTMKGKAISADWTTVCTPNGTLSIQSVDAKGAGDDEFQTYTLQRAKDGKAEVARTGADGKVTKSTISLPEDAVSFTGLVRIAACLPRETGKSYAFPALFKDTSPQLKQPGYSIKCIDRMGMELAGKEVALTRYRVFESDGRGGERNFMEIFTDDGGVVHKVVVDGRKTWTLVEK
jgi:hypothetical protein